MNVGKTTWPFGEETRPGSMDPVDQLASELTEDDRKLVDWIADQVVSRRLTAPALFLIESSKPLNFVSSQLLVVLAPMLGPFLPRVPYDRLVVLLEKRPFLELLIRAIESSEDDLLSARRAEKAARRAAKKAKEQEP